MRFSIVIPLYNKCWAIAKTLESVFEQSFQDFEVVVVDDGSTDGGCEVVESIGDPRLRLLKQENAGVSSARNAGIRFSSGEIVCFLDADDRWYEGHLEEIDRLARKYPSAKFYTDKYEICYRNRPNVIPEFPGLNEVDGLVVNYAYACCGLHNAVHSSTAAVDRAALLAMDVLFPEGVAIGEDLDLWLRLAMRYPLAYSSKVGACYDRDTGDNARTRNSVHCPTALFQTLEKALKGHGTPPSWKPFLKRIYDRKMVAYTFSLINARKGADARKVLQSWVPEGKYMLYKPGLQMARALPSEIVTAVQRLRMRLY